MGIDCCCKVAGDRSQSEEFLYNQEKLSKLAKWPEITKQLSELNLVARPLSKLDFERGYLDLLRQLTYVGEVTKKNFEDRFDRMKSVNNYDEHYFITVIEDSQTNKLVACTTLSFELKFIHECSIRGRIEDVVCLDSYRGKKIGQIIVKILVELARESGCYKLTLDCTDELKKFYQLNGFNYDLNMMCIRFDGH